MKSSLELVGLFSDLADQSIIIPASAAIFLVLFMIGRRRDAYAWLCAIIACSSIILILKIWFERCGVPAHRIVYSPSGHAMAGTLFYAGSLALWFTRWPPILISTALISAAFSSSRILLGVHTIPEVAIGGTVGACGVMALGFFKSHERKLPSREAFIFISVFLLFIFYMHGKRLPIEHEIQIWSHRHLSNLMCINSPHTT